MYCRYQSRLGLRSILDLGYLRLLSRFLIIQELDFIEGDARESRLYPYLFTEARAENLPLWLFEIGLLVCQAWHTNLEAFARYTTHSIRLLLETFSSLQLACF